MQRTCATTNFRERPHFHVYFTPGVQAISILISWQSKIALTNLSSASIN